MTVGVYRFIAPLTDLDALPCVETQVYQALHVLVAEVALHSFSFLALATQKGGFLTPHRARKPPYESDTKRRLDRRLPVRGCVCG